MDRLTILSLMGLLLVILGFVTLFSALLLGESTSVGGAIVVFIGPFPLAVGFGEYSPALILVGVVIAVAMLIMLANIKNMAKKRDIP